MSYGYGYSRKGDGRKRRTEGFGTPTTHCDPNFKYRDSDTATSVRRRHFPSISQFASYIENNGKAPTEHTEGIYSEGYYSKGLKLFRLGDPDMVPQARDLMKKVSAKLPTVTRQWELKMAGAFPSVPDYLAGNPENMYTFPANPDDNAPVRIWVNVLPSGGCSSKQLLMRGVVIVALVALLQQRRNQVRVTAYADQPCSEHYDRHTGQYVKPGVIVACDLPTMPISLSRLCTALGHPYVVQGLFYRATEITDSHVNGGWLRGHEPTYGYDEPKVRIDLGASPDDVILPALHLADPMLNDPLGFVKRELDRILKDTNLAD